MPPSAACLFWIPSSSSFGFVTNFLLFFFLPSIVYVVEWLAYKFSSCGFGWMEWRSACVIERVVFWGGQAAAAAMCGCCCLIFLIAGLVRAPRETQAKVGGGEDTRAEPQEDIVYQHLRYRRKTFHFSCVCGHMWPIWIPTRILFMLLADSFSSFVFIFFCANHFRFSSGRPERNERIKKSRGL